MAGSLIPLLSDLPKINKSAETANSVVLIGRGYKIELVCKDAEPLEYIAGGKHAAQALESIKIIHEDKETTISLDGYKTIDFLKGQAYAYVGKKGHIYVILDYWDIPRSSGAAQSSIWNVLTINDGKIVHASHVDINP